MNVNHPKLEGIETFEEIMQLVAYGDWNENLKKIDHPLVWACHYCGNTVSSKGLGWKLVGKSSTEVRGLHLGWTAICNVCNLPSFLAPNDKPILQPLYGKPVANLAIDVEEIYNEARRSYSVSAFSAVILLCRKLIMHVAHDLDPAPDSKSKRSSFVAYIDSLEKLGYIPPNGKAWVDFLRTRGNQENHELIRATSEDAKMILDFSHYLLVFAYELPSVLRSQE